MLPDEALRRTDGHLSVEGARATTRAGCHSRADYHFCTDPIIILDRAFGCLIFVPVRT